MALFGGGDGFIFKADHRLEVITESNSGAYEERVKNGTVNEEGGSWIDFPYGSRNGVLGLVDAARIKEVRLVIKHESSRDDE